MPREVTHTATGPRKLSAADLDEENGDIAICLCGLSEEFPFCDGSHRQTADEADDVCYKYVDGERRVVAAVEYADADTVAAADHNRDAAGGDTGD